MQRNRRVIYRTGPNAVMSANTRNVLPLRVNRGDATANAEPR